MWRIMTIWIQIQNLKPIEKVLMVQNYSFDFLKNEYFLMTRTRDFSLQTNTWTSYSSRIDFNQWNQFIVLERFSK